MGKNYTDELARWVTKRQGKPRERNLVTFNGLQDDVRTALEAGYSSKTIWAHMHEQGRVDFGYETFLVYVNRVIKTARSAKPGTRSGEDVIASATTAGTARPVSLPPLLSPAPSDPSTPPVPCTPTRRTGMPTFKFNPIPQREDNA
jgi:hypothetical protein